MNQYAHTFVVECPSNAVRVQYTLTLTTPGRVMVEDIVEACSVARAYHEELADTLYARFGGRQVMSAFHHGVWITTTRGDG